MARVVQLDAGAFPAFLAGEEQAVVPFDHVAADREGRSVVTGRSGRPVVADDVTFDQVAAGADSPAVIAFLQVGRICSLVAEVEADAVGETDDIAADDPVPAGTRADHACLLPLGMLLLPEVRRILVPAAFEDEILDDDVRQLALMRREEPSLRGQLDLMGRRLVVGEADRQFAVGVSPRLHPCLVLRLVGFLDVALIIDEDLAEIKRELRIAERILAFGLGFAFTAIRRGRRSDAERIGAVAVGRIREHRFVDPARIETGRDLAPFRRPRIGPPDDRGVFHGRAESDRGAFLATAGRSDALAVESRGDEHRIARLGEVGRALNRPERLSLAARGLVVALRVDVQGSRRDGEETGAEQQGRAEEHV